ncbi:MAG: T9SS type A sorting domain-containing protein, partial [Gemmatimonadetes bacterium]|nr:T9SS type A sorting domain-containing protein [Gemmatimonadota bacterium]
ELTFTAVLAGEEFRLGVDRDDDGFRDQDERDVGADPDDPLSTPDDFVGAPVVAGGPQPLLWMKGQNPARDHTRLGFQTARSGPVRMDVYDIRGRRIRTLLQSPRQAPGAHEHVWNLRDATGHPVSSGVYFIRMETPDGTARERVTVLR